MYLDITRQLNFIHSVDPVNIYIYVFTKNYIAHDIS